MKWYIWVIIVLSLLTIGSGMATGYAIITGKNKILEMKLETKELTDNFGKAVISKNMRDEILEKIALENKFKNFTKIQLQIDRWKQLKETEKPFTVNVSGNTVNPKWETIIGVNPLSECGLKRYIDKRYGVIIYKSGDGKITCIKYEGEK